MQSLTRREAIVLGAVSTTIILVGARGSARPTPAAAAAQIAKFTGGKIPETGQITIELPEIAENGSSIALSVAVDSPMTADNHGFGILAGRHAIPRSSTP